MSEPEFLDQSAMPTTPTGCGGRSEPAQRRTAPRARGRTGLPDRPGGLLGALARAWHWAPLALVLAVSTSTACARPARELDAARVCALVRDATKAGDDLLLARSLAEELGLEPSNLWIDRNGVFVRTGGFSAEKQGLFLARPGVTPPAEGADPSFTPVSGCVYRYAIKG